jgi:hypothetical protein
MTQFEYISGIEKDLSTAADTLRSNSNYASNEYFLPVMGLIFLRHAYSRLITSHHDHLESSSDHLEPSSDHLELSSDHWTKLMSIAQPITEKGKVPRELMEQAIQELCQDQFLTQKQLAQLLNRSPHTLRTGYLTKMVQNGILQLKYPGKATHPDQGDRTSDLSNLPSSD